MNVAAPQAKERIRGPDLAVFIKRKEGVPMEDAIRRADEAGLVMASNKRLSNALVGSEGCRSISDAPCWWTGTMTGYVKPGRTFRQETERISSIDNGHFIAHTDPKTKIRYLFPVMEGYLDKSDCILAVNHPDFELVKDGNDRIIRAARIDLIERFPDSYGWYLGDAKYDIPHGDAVDGRNQDARFFQRTEGRVGLVVRSVYDNINWRSVSILGHGASNALGVAVEAPPV
jgi:hypothetical protein